MPSLLILMPLFGIILMNMPFMGVLRKAAFWFAVTIFFVQISLAVFHHFLLLHTNPNIIDPFFKINFAVDNLSFIMLICIGMVSLAGLVVARYTIDNEDRRFDFINLLIIASIGMSGTVIVTDVFSLYVFLEITAVSSFILIAFRRDKYALEGAFKYIVLSSIATALMLSSVALLMLTAGDVSFSAIRDAMQASRSSVIVTFAVSIFVAGLFIKGGLVPFHGWLPDAYSAAPASVSVLLAGVITKVAGIYTLIRVTTSLFGFDGNIKGILLFVGALSIVTGAFAALKQSDFKRMLAYSSISQIGYIILGLGTGTALGIMGGIFHLFNHSVFKALLFVNSAAVEKEAGTRDMDKLGGLSSRMPVTGATSVVALLSACGIPPLAGFWSKLLIILALWQAGNIFYACIAVLASIVTLGYLLSMQRRVFFGKLLSGLENIKEAEMGFSVVAITLAAITIGVGVFFPVIFNSFIMPLGEILR